MRYIITLLPTLATLLLECPVTDMFQKSHEIKICHQQVTHDSPFFFVSTEDANSPKVRPWQAILQNLLRSKSPLIWDLANDDNLREITVVIIKWAAGLVIILMRFLLRRQ